MANSAKAKTLRGAKTTYYQQLAMIEWLEVPQKFRLITGAAQKDVGKVVAGAKLKKEQAYADLMVHVNQKTGCKWTATQAATRFKSMLATYKRVQTKFYDTTGEKYCLTGEEISAGLTVEAKVDKECYGFFRLHSLFGGRQNINPACLYEPSLDDDESESFFIVAPDSQLRPSADEESTYDEENETQLDINT